MERLSCQNFEVVNIPEGLTSNSSSRHDNPIWTAVKQRAALCPHEVYNEKCWFEQQEAFPENVVQPQLDQSLLLQYQEMIWHNHPHETVPQFGMTVAEMSHLCNSAELLSPHMIWMMEQLNRSQRDAVCLYLQGSPAASLIPHLQRRGLPLQSIKRLVVIASVVKDSNNAVCLSDESGSHWVLVVVDLTAKEIFYCDSLAWDIPPNLLQRLQEYCNYFNCELTAASVVLCHEVALLGNNQHVCSDDCISYCLQPQNSNASGIITLINAAVSACNWEMFFLLISGAQTACYLNQPIDYEVYLRKVLICWFMSGTVDMQNIQLKTKTGSGYQSPSDRISQQPSTDSGISRGKDEAGGHADEESPHHSTNGIDVEKCMASSKTPAKAKTQKVKLECNICNKMLGSRAALFKHKRCKHPGHEYRQAPEKSHLHCIDCGLRCFYATKLIEHYQSQHGRQFSIEKKKFATEAEFQSWKKWVEKKSMALFVQQSGKRFTPTTLVRNFRCNRSGFYISKGRGVRSLKSQGSARINATCPAFIKSTMDRTLQSVEAEFCLDHTHECEVKHLHLSSDTRKMIAEKLVRGVSIDAIIEEIRLSCTSTDREHHITRRDVMNVKLTLNVEVDSKLESAYFTKINLARKEALKSVEEVTSLIKTSSSMDILRNILRHLHYAAGASRGVEAMNNDHDYQGCSWNQSC
ncbi:uncharacterized protein LOC110981051 [Acanthaster planci]|uniref:Uncharacterized protein LOC110981051 n=1 Tax=Acanthaster planci TaxID=133434 RepID=A0A8B7YN88_ACAPL|nr:uncharacterized protein LOC110981051 [Acanthaster planci]